MVLCIWGTEAAGGPYAAIAALTNIPAMLLAAAVPLLYLLRSGGERMKDIISHSEIAKQERQTTSLIFLADKQIMITSFALRVQQLV